MNRIRSVGSMLGVIALGFSSTVYSLASNAAGSVDVAEHGCSAVLDTQKGKSFALRYHLAGNGRQVSGIQAPSWLSDSDERTCLMAQGDGKAWVFLVRTPSAKRQGVGFCGAGHEDRLVYVFDDGQQARIGNGILVQSCLQSLSLESDDADNVKSAFEVDAARQEIRFAWLGKPGGKRVRIDGARIELHEVKK